jgi:PAS domain S-box-containing protein
MTTDSEYRADQRVQLANVLLIELDTRGQVQFLNAAGARILGWPESELLGRDWIETCIPEEEREATRAAFRGVCTADSADSRHESQVLTQDGGRRFIAWTHRALRDPSGTLAGTLISGTDVTEERKALEWLRASQRQMEELQRALDASVIVAATDTAGRIVYANEQFTRISGYGQDELLGQTHRIINSGVHPKSLFRDLWQTIQRGQVWRGDLCNRRKSGELYWVSTTIVPVLDEQTHRPIRYLAIRKDITELKDAERKLQASIQALAETSQRAEDRAHALEQADHALRNEQSMRIQSEKLSSIGLLAAGVAHEINNPLAGVVGCVRALRQDNLPDDRREQYFDTVEDALNRIQITVRSLLDFSRQQDPKREAVDALELVRSAERIVHPALQSKQLRFVEPTVDARGVWIFVDRAQVLQATVNVLLNAAFASPEAGRIDFAFRLCGPQVGIEIRDGGAGIPDAIRNQICEPFFTTKAPGEGTGLGLTVTLSLLQRNDGTLEFSTPPDGGTVVTLWLPATQQERRIDASNSSG